MNVIKDFKNGLFNRREVSVSVSQKGNPGMVNASKMVSEHFKAEEGQVVVKDVQGRFGRDDFLINAFVYDSVEAKDKTEIKKKIKEKKAQ